MRLLPLKIIRNKIIRQKCKIHAMNKKTIRVAILSCIAAMISAIAYAFIRLYVMNQRVDLSILIVNVVVFTISGILMIYLSRKEREIEEEELFRD